MRIIYVAKHGCGGNDDEGAISHAFRQLGHQVTQVHETEARRVPHIAGGDLVLFHKWDDADTLAKVKGKLIRAFWYFDLVDFPDSTIGVRNVARMRWMEKVLPHIDIGFCTDGDWVEKVNNHPGQLFAPGAGKLKWLAQGADERVAFPGMDRQTHKSEILFTGIGARGGTGREDFVRRMARYGTQFLHVKSGVHGRAMADLIANHKIVVAPSSPVTARYWSNRVYNALGFGAFVLHPDCERLHEHYKHCHDLVMYQHPVDMHQKIAHYLEKPEERKQIAHQGYLTTRERHLYRHRCEELLKAVGEMKT